MSSDKLQKVLALKYIEVRAQAYSLLSSLFLHLLPLYFLFFHTGYLCKLCEFLGLVCVFFSPFSACLMLPHPLSAYSQIWFNSFFPSKSFVLFLLKSWVTFGQILKEGLSFLSSHFLVFFFKSSFIFHFEWKYVENCCDCCNLKFIECCYVAVTCFWLLNLFYLYHCL